MKNEPKPSFLLTELKAIIAREEISQQDLMKLWKIETRQQVTRIMHGLSPLTDIRFMKVCDACYVFLPVNLPLNRLQ